MIESVAIKSTPSPGYGPMLEEAKDYTNRLSTGEAMTFDLPCLQPSPRIEPETKTKSLPSSPVSGSSGNRHHSGIFEPGAPTDVGTGTCITKKAPKDKVTDPLKTAVASTMYDYVDYTKIAGRSGEKYRTFAHMIEVAY